MAGIRVLAPDGIYQVRHSLQNSSHGYIAPPQDLYYHLAPASPSSRLDSRFAPLLRCPRSPNPHTRHIRLSNAVYNISMTPAGSAADGRIFWNPSIISLPYWSQNQYLLVSRIITDGSHQETVICEANICHADSDGSSKTKGKACTEDDLAVLGSAGGLRCATPPVVLDVPPTASEHCTGRWMAVIDLPGFHDPRIFWSGKGEPLMMLNTHSRYTCFGLSMLDLRVPYSALAGILSSDPLGPDREVPMSYPHLTELTRNPPSTRGMIEKNWIFFSKGEESYLHYDLSPTRRTFAKLLGGGLTTPNLTSPFEPSCFPPDLEHSLPSGAEAQLHSSNETGTVGTWHQATPSLRLVLCHRRHVKKKKCQPGPSNTVFVSVMHRKIKGMFGLPVRYERYMIAWEAEAPFHVVGMSEWPILLGNETAGGWTAEENWDDTSPLLRNSTSMRDASEGNASAHARRYAGADGTEAESMQSPEKGMWAPFTYTVSIAYAWGRVNDGPGMKNVGFLDDDIIMGVGIADEGQGFARVKAEELVACMRACPGGA